MDAAVDGRNPVSKHQIQPECGESAGCIAGRHRRTCLARPNSQARMGTEICPADHEQDWEPSPVGSYSAISDGYTYRTRYLLADV